MVARQEESDGSVGGISALISARAIMADSPTCWPLALLLKNWTPESTAGSCWPEAGTRGEIVSTRRAAVMDGHQRERSVMAKPEGSGRIAKRQSRQSNSILAASAGIYEPTFETGARVCHGRRRVHSWARIRMFRNATGP